MTNNKIGYGLKKYYTDDALKKYDKSQFNIRYGSNIRVFLFCGLNILIFGIYTLYDKYNYENNIIENEESEEDKLLLTIQLFTDILYYSIIILGLFIFFNFLFSLEYNDSFFIMSFGKFFNYFKTHIYIFLFFSIIYMFLFSPLSFANTYFNIFNNKLNLKKNLLKLFSIILFFIFISYIYIIFYTLFSGYNYKPILFTKNYKSIFKI